MVRKLACAIALAGVVAFAAPTVALADDSSYPAPAVSSTPYPAPPITSIEVLPTSSSIPSTTSGVVGATTDPSAPSSDGLAYTGVSFNIALVAAIAVLVVLLGVALIVVGTHRALRRRRPRHS